MGNQVFWTVLSLSLSGTIVGILILCARPLTKKYFSKKWNYYVWLVMVVRLLIPFSLGINLVGSLFAAGGAGNTAAGGREAAAGTSVTAELQSEGTLPADGEGGDVVEPLAPVRPWGAAAAPEESVAGKYAGAFSYLWVAWLFGAVLAACVKWNDYRNFAAYVKADREEIREGSVRALADELSAKIGIKRVVKVYESSIISGPVMIGMMHPGIILPKKTAGQEDISLILHHELVHCKKRDLWYKWLYQAVLCIHWFNPFLYLAERKFNVDCELACDEAVLEILTLEGRKAYGNVLLDAAEYKMNFKKSVLSTTLLEDKNTLKERLYAILHYKKVKGAIVAASICAAALILRGAGLAGAKHDRVYTGNHPAGQTMAGSYVSGWNAAVEGYTSFWDHFGETAGNVWDGIGQMWQGLGYALEDAFADFAENAGYSGEKGPNGIIWSYFDGSGQFLAQDIRFDTQGEAWELYEDDQAIAGQDVNDEWYAYRYVGNGVDVDCEGLILNGSGSFQILYAKEAFDQTLDVEAELLSGKMKLVHVGADGSVTLLTELEEGGSVGKSVTVPLTEGRNAVKIVGQGAKIKSLNLRFGNRHNKNILKLFGDEVYEAAEMITDDFRKGDINAARFMDVLPYMKNEDLLECVKILFGSGADLTAEQIRDMLIYGNSDVGKCLADAVEKGTMKPLTGDEIVEYLIPYVDSEDAMRLVENVEEPISFEILEDFLIYLNADAKEKCLELYLEQGNKLTYEQFSEISPYLDADVIRRLDEVE